jgi:hypothetical protein
MTTAAATPKRAATLYPRVEAAPLFELEGLEDRSASSVHVLDGIDAATYAAAEEEAAEACDAALDEAREATELTLLEALEALEITSYVRAAYDPVDRSG